MPLNRLYSFIDNGTKVTEILKERSLDLDNIVNLYISGEKCEEKLVKITSAKQKLKSVFTSLQQRKPSLSSRPNKQPFVSDPLPGHKQGNATGRGL